MEPYVSSSEEESEEEEEVNPIEENILDSPKFRLDDPIPSEFLLPTTGRYVDMDSQLVAYGQDDTEFLFDQDA